MRRLGIWVSVLPISCGARALAAESHYQPPALRRAAFNFNPGRKFTFAFAAGTLKPVANHGGFNAGKPNTTNNLDRDTGCGINRVAVGSARTAGKIAVTKTRAGLTPATITIESQPVEITNGPDRSLPPTLPGVALATAAK